MSVSVGLNVPVDVESAIMATHSCIPASSQNGGEKTQLLDTHDHTAGDQELKSTMTVRENSTAVPSSPVSAADEVDLTLPTNPSQSVTSESAANSPRSKPASPPPDGLMKLLSLATQYRVRHASQSATSPDGRPDFLISSTLRQSERRPPEAIRLRAVRYEDLAAISDIDFRTTMDRGVHHSINPGVQKYPRDHKRAIRWSWREDYYTPRSAMMVAEIGDGSGEGSRNGGSKVVGLIKLTWQGKPRRDDGEAGSSKAKVQIKPVLQRFLVQGMYKAASRLDRSLDRKYCKVLDAAYERTVFLPASVSGLDRAALFENLSAKSKGENAAKSQSTKRSEPQNSQLASKQTQSTADEGTATPDSVPANDSPASDNKAMEKADKAKNEDGDKDKAKDEGGGDKDKAKVENPAAYPGEDLSTFGGGGDFWTVGQLLVDPDWRGRGVGAALMRAAVAAVAARGEHTTLVALPGVDKFYERLGFRRFGAFDAPAAPVSGEGGGEWVWMYRRPGAV